MKKIFLLLTIIGIHLFSFSQDITYKNAWGEEVIGPSIEDAVYDGVSRALDDVLDALEEKERKAALERSKMSFAERARKVGISIPSYSLDDPIGRAAFEGLIIQRERAKYLAEVKRARDKYSNRNGNKDANKHNAIVFEFNGKKDKLQQITSYFGQIKSEVMSKALVNNGLTEYNEIKEKLDSISKYLQNDLSEVKKVKHKIIIYENYIKKVNSMNLNYN